jgi:RNA polymerase sigma-70 factor (ECF subfamily)
MMANQAKEQNDDVLVSRAREGDDDAFGELLHRYQRPVLNFVYRLLANETEAEDVAQDTFVRAYQHLADFDPRRKFSTWLFALARNTAIDRLRYRHRHPTEPLDTAPESSTVSNEVGNREVGVEIAAAIAQLPEDQRTAIVLAEYHDLSYTEIAEVMNSSEKSIESRLYRAKITLRERLAHLLN